MTDSTASTEYFSNLNSTQLKVLALAPKVTSILSIAGCSYMICKILICKRCESRAGRINNNCTYTNLLLGLSLADFITSIAYFLSTWPIPKDNIYSDILWGEAGNQTTCNIQGFMVQFGCVSSIMYTCSINLHFLLGIRNKWLPSQFEKIDPILHVVSVLIPLGTAILGWFKTLYNPTLSLCWLRAYPIGCSSAVECIRGYNASLYALFMGLLPVLLGLFFIFTVMAMIYKSVYHQEKATSRYRIGEENENRKSRRAFILACQYEAAFCVSFVPPAIITIVGAILGNKMSFGWRILHSLFSPLQGFLNSIVYSFDLKDQVGTSYCAHDDRYITQRERRQPIPMMVTKIASSGESDDQQDEAEDPSFNDCLE